MAISNLYTPPIKQYSSKPVPQAYDASGAPVYANAGANLAPTNALNTAKQGFSAPQQTQYDKTMAMFKTPIKSVKTGADGSSTITSHTPVKTDNPDTTKPDSTKTDTSGGAGTFTGATGGLMGYGTGQSNNPLVAGSANTQTDISTGAGPATIAQTGLQNIATNGSQAVIDAQKALKDFQIQSAGLMSAMSSNPNVAGDIASSRNNSVATNLTAQYNALTQNLANALAQQGQQITAGTQAGSIAQTQQGQQITAANNVGALGTSQQGQNIGALGTAGSLTQKSGTFPFVFDPSTGQFTNAGGGASSANGISFTGNVTQDAQTAAKAVISGKMTYQQAQQSMSYAGSTANNFLNSAILNAGGDVSALEAQGASKQANITTSATTPTNAAASVYADSYSKLLDIQQTTSNIDQFGSLLTKTMVAPDGTTINPSDAKFATKTIADIRNQLSSQQQATFDTTFAQLRAQIATLLSSGGSQIPTQITSDANKIIDGSAPLGTLTATLARIKTEGDILTSNLQTKMNTAGSVIHAPTSGNSNPLGI